MNTLRDIFHDLKVTLDDLKDLLEIVDLLKHGKIKTAIKKIRYLDTPVRDDCVKYFNEDALHQVELKGRGKLTGRTYTCKELAEKVEMAIVFYISANLGYHKKDLKEYFNA